MTRGVHYGLVALYAVGCTQDAGFTPLRQPAPSVTDTSEPPEEETDTGDTGSPPPECPQPEIVSAIPGERDPSCANEQVRTALDATEEWSRGSFSTFPEYEASYGAPVVGHLTDDDGDGTHGSTDDVPDIVTVFYAPSVGGSPCVSGAGTPNGVLRVLSGADGAEHWAIQDLPAPYDHLQVNNFFSPALGDVDADGFPNVVVGVSDGPSGTDQRIAALNPDGSVLWVSPRLSDAGEIWLAEIYDLDQDGIPEVYADGRVLSGSTGDQLWTDRVLPRGPSIVVDLEGDGTNELITVDGIWEPDGTERCHHNLPGEEIAVADLDGDGRGEVITTSTSTVAVTSPECRLEAFRYTGTQSTAIGDVDADGLPEIVFASYFAGIGSSELVAVEADTSVVWQENINTPAYTKTGTTLFDFEGDGFPEAIYASRFELRIHSGTDGATRFIDEDRYSCPMQYDRPVPVDVDADGSVEIVTATTRGVKVYGDRLGGWVGGRSVWNQHGFSGTNIETDLSVPALQTGNWPTFNHFRAGDARPNRGQAAGLVDVRPAIVNVCEVECDRGMLQLTVRVENAGMADATDGLQTALYRVDSVGETTLLQVFDTQDPVRSGFSTEGITVRIPTDEIPEGTIMVVADDDGMGQGGIDECTEDNNSTLLEGLCGDL